MVEGRGPGTSERGVGQGNLNAGSGGNMDSAGFEITSNSTDGMAARIDRMDWSRTPLGPKEKWPATLKMVVDLCVNTRFPMRIWWGRELINLYNDSYARSLGKRHPEALGRPAQELWPEIWPNIAPQVEAVMQRGESTWNERVHMVMERNGSPEDVWLTWSYSPIRDAAGEVCGLLGIAYEDTAAVLAERERDRLHEQQRAMGDQARNILESITDGFFALDRAWRFSYVNSQCGRILERAPEDLIGKKIYDEYPGFAGSELETMYQAVMDNRVAASVTTYYPDHDRWYEAHAYPAPEGISIYFRDVTENKRIQETAKTLTEKFERQSRLFEGISSTTPDFIYVFDLSGRFIYANRRLLEVWGVTFDQAVGKSLIELGYPQWHADMHHRELRQVLETKKPIKGEVPFTGGSGISGMYEYIFTPVLDENGNVEVIAGTTRDVTDRRRIEAEKQALLESERAARSEAERASNMKDEFLATLSHELRTPLMAILGWSQLISRPGVKPEDVAQGVDVIQRNARAQSQIIEDLLDMSRIISGKIRLDLQRLDLSVIVQAAVDALRPTAEAKGVRLQAVLDPLHGVAINGDASRLQQVLWNLIANAVKFTPRGGRVQVVLERVGSNLEVSVIDTGEGIKADFLPFVFDRFRQADGTTTRTHGGLGLGLSIVRQLVELHGGTVRAVSSGQGCGATFVVSLPITALHPEPPKDGRAEKVESSAPPCDTPFSQVDIAGLRVLVVDDEKDTRGLLTRILEDCRAVVTTAESADEAMLRISSSSFDVIISDIGLPGEDGYSFLKRVRMLDKSRGGDTPAIALTAFARAEDRIRAIAAGFQMHLAKPVEPQELIVMVAGAATAMGSTAAKS